MATTDNAPQATTSGQTTSQRGRDRVAQLVVVGSFLTLFILVGVLIGLGQSSNLQASDAAKTAFTSILPVLAGWVGTVLAFYFSAASHDRTSQSLDRVISQTVGGPSPSVRVSEKMIPVLSIAGLQTLDNKRQPKDIKIKDLKTAFETELPSHEKVTRLLFVENGVFRYILHRAALDKFIAKSPPPAAAIDDKTFADMLGDPETLRWSKLVVSVSAATTLGDAKAALDKESGAQDIIVTGSGNPAEPMLGWLSNVDLIKALQVG